MRNVSFIIRVINMSFVAFSFFLFRRMKSLIQKYQAAHIASVVKLVIGMREFYGISYFAKRTRRIVVHSFLLTSRIDSSPIRTENALRGSTLDVKILIRDAMGTARKAPTTPHT